MADSPALNPFCSHAAIAWTPLPPPPPLPGPCRHTTPGPCITPKHTCSAGLQAENAALKKLIEEVVSDSTVAQERVAKLRGRYSHLLHNVRSRMAACHIYCACVDECVPAWKLHSHKAVLASNGTPLRRPALSECKPSSAAMQGQAAGVALTPTRSCKPFHAWKAQTSHETTLSKCSA